MEYVYGIDLGTTYSNIAECDEELRISVILPDKVAEPGSTIVPSVVYYEEPDGKPIVGRDAKDQLGFPSTNRVVSLFKREMGKNELEYETLVGDHSEKLSPIEPSAYLLHSLITSNDNRDRLAGDYRKKKKAVITVPASFTNKQRLSTKIAAELAGIEVLGLLQEPTAAAISYDIKPGETILVFDLGGGTLDVSIVNCKLVNGKAHYSVLATAGDYNVLNEYIGGIDWDKELKNYVLDVLSDYKIGTLEDNSAEEWKLRCAAEKCKIKLSNLRSADFQLPNYKSCKVTRAQFRDQCDELLEKCKKVVIAAIDKINKDMRIDKCVMAGGSSQMPMIEDMLRDVLSERIGVNYKNKDEWLLRVDPANAIVKGAAKYAYYLVHNNAANVEFLEDLHPYSYGVLIKKDNKSFVKNIIHSTDPMEIRGKEYYFTPINREEIKVWLYENTCPNEGFWYNDINKYVYEKDPIATPSYPFDSSKTIDEKTKVVFRVSRNVDGIISIEIICEGHPSKKYAIKPISDERIVQILERIKKMDTE